jgi:hypothetical protein
MSSVEARLMLFTIDHGGSTFVVAFTTLRKAENLCLEGKLEGEVMVRKLRIMGSRNINWLVFEGVPVLHICLLLLNNNLPLPLE